MKKNGFTIVELVTVIILLGILSAVALPRFFNNDSFTSFFDTAEFESTLSWVRNRAITTQCAHEVRISTSGWQVLKDDDRDGSSADFDCDSTANAGLGCNAAAGEFFSFAYSSDADLVSDGSNTLLTSDTVTALAAQPVQRLIFTATGKLHKLTDLPPNLAQGCTALSASTLVPANTGLILNELSLTMDGDTAYVAIQ